MGSHESTCPYRCRTFLKLVGPNGKDMGGLLKKSRSCRTFLKLVGPHGKDMGGLLKKSRSCRTFLKLVGPT
jgi:hypothetical protein